jgi:AcrR family transcriptional regulator
MSTFVLDLGPDPDMMKNSGQTRRERPYHHGDLYSSLVKAAEDLLEEKGANALSLREVCQCAGVSHAAPYRHFRDKAALMEAVAKAGFNQLGEMISEARARHPGEPEMQILDAGRAYVAWATENPERTRLMFGGMMKSDTIDEDLHQSAEAAYEEIYRIIDEGRSTGVFGGRDTDSVVLSAWSAVHGLTMLILGSGKLTPENPRDVRGLADIIGDTVLSGIRSR